MRVKLPPLPNIETMEETDEIFYATLEHLDALARVIGGKAWRAQHVRSVEGVVNSTGYLDDYPVASDDEQPPLETSETRFLATKVGRRVGNGVDIGLVFNISFTHSVSTDMESIPPEHRPKVIQHFLDEDPNLFDEVPTTAAYSEYADELPPTEASDFDQDIAYDACCAATLGMPRRVFESRSIEFIVDEFEQYFERRKSFGYLILGQFVEAEDQTYSVEPASIIPVCDQRTTYVEEFIPVGDEVIETIPDREKISDTELGEACIEEHAFLEIIGTNYDEEDVAWLGWPHQLHLMLKLGRKVAKKRR
jgi:hypothetical protein